MSKESTVGVYGIGRFGLFWSRLLAGRFRVLVNSRSKKTGLPEDVRWVEFNELFEADTLFLCVAISSIPDVVQRMAPHLSSRHLVIDTCSVKVFPEEQMLTHLPAEVSVIASHPMFGPDSARERRDQLPMIMWRSRCQEERYTFWTDVFRSMNMRVLEMNPHDHDREAAYSQGVTHYVGRLLSLMDLPRTNMATLGYQRLLQVMEQTCNDPVQLFRDLQRFNPYTREMRAQLAEARRQTEAMLPEDYYPTA